MKSQQTLQRWKQRILLWGFVLVAISFATLFAASDPFSAHAATTLPTKMNFQGRLTNSAGNIVANGTYNMRFKIYDQQAPGGTSQWSEDRLVSATQGVVVTNGQFSVQLGEITPLPASVFTSNSRFFEIELPTPATATTSSPVWTELPMTPRNQLATSAYAYNAETLDGIDGSSFALLGSGNAFTAANTFSGTSGFTNTLDVNVANANALRVRNGATNLFNVDTTNSIVSVGTSDTTGAVLVLDTKTGSGDPTGGSATNGAMYYNSNANKFRCYENGAWKDCDTSGGAISSGDTASRPGSPTQGTQYFDTDTDRLLVYANGKWQADRSEVILVASNTSSQADRDAADYVTNGNTAAVGDGDQVEINTALGAGKKVALLAGTYTIDESVQIPNNTTLTGVGDGTLIQLATTNLSDDMVETTGTGKTGQTLRDLRIDGGTNTSGTQRGISILNTDNMRINSVTVSNMRNDGLYTNTSTNLTITDSTFKDNDDRGVYLDSATENVMFSNNIVTGSVNAGLLTYSVYGLTINDNVFDGNPIDAIVLNLSSSVTISSNSITDNQWGMAIVDSDDVSIDGNTLLNNYGGDAIHLTDSNRISITDNRLHNNGAATAGSGIKVSNSDDAYITGNSITDTAGTGYAIDINLSTSDRTYLADNVYSGTGAASINNAGTGTVYGGQLNGSSNYLIQPAGTIELMKNTNVTGTLDVSSSIDAATGFSFNGTSGSTATCSGGQVFQNQVVQGGIVTGGSCVASSGAPSLQDAYNNSSSPATITTTAAKGVSIAAGAAPTSDLLSVSNSGQATNTNGVDGISVNYAGGSTGSIAGSGIRVDYTPGSGASSVWSGMRIVSGNSSASTTNYGLNIEGPGTGSGNDIGLRVASGFDIGVDIESGGLEMTGVDNTGEPGTITAGDLRLYARTNAGRTMLKMKGGSGIDTTLQPFFGANRIAMFAPILASTSITTSTTFGATIGLNHFTAGTTASTTATTSETTVSTGVLFTSMKRTEIGTSTAVSTVGDLRLATLQYMRGNAAGIGGFYAVGRYGISTYQTGARTFAGMEDASGALTNAEVSSNTNIIGFGCDTADTTMSFIRNDGSGTATKIALGANYPCNTSDTDVYEYRLFVPPNGSTIYYSLARLNTTDFIEGSVTTDIPATTTLLTPHFYIGNNATAARAEMDIMSLYVETDN